MFDLKGLQSMGHDIELFTKQTHAALTDIDMQLRLNNALLAMEIAVRANDGSNVAGVLEAAIIVARNMPDLPALGEGSGS